MNTTPTTPTEAITAALAAHPESSAAELAEATGLGGSTASKHLATLERDGTVVRHLGGHEGRRRVADRWALADTVASTEPGAEDAAAVEEDASATRSFSTTSKPTATTRSVRAHSARRSVDLPVRSRTRASASNPRAASAS
jgi:predicted ArsR family transcriptional regulator